MKFFLYVVRMDDLKLDYEYKIFQSSKVEDKKIQVSKLQQE